MRTFLQYNELQQKVDRNCYVTRFYLPSTGAADVSPAASAGWEDTSINSFLKAVTTKISSAMTTVSFADADATNKDILFRTYVSDPIAGQAIASQTIELQMRVKERATSCNMFLTWNIKVVSNDGSVVRGTITSMERDATEASAVALTNRRETSTSTAVVAQSGDRIVIEVGMGGDPAAGSDHDSDISVGDDSASDLPEDDTDTNAFNPWIEFPNTLTFFTSGDIIVHEITSVTGATDVITQAHTVSANLSNKGILVFAGAYDPVSSSDRAVSSVTYNSVALTKLVELPSTLFATYDSIWFLANPSTGSNNVVVTYGGVCDGNNVDIVTLGNVLQSTQPDATQTAEDSATSTFDGTITTLTDRSMVLSRCNVDVFGGITESSPQVLIADQDYWVSSYTNPTSPAGNVTHTYTSGSTDNGDTIMVAIKQFVSAVTGSGFPTWRTLTGVGV